MRKNDRRFQKCDQSPAAHLLDNLDKLLALDMPIVVLSDIGHRAALPTPALRPLGYTNVLNLNGGFNAWDLAKLPLEY